MGKSDLKFGLLGLVVLAICQLADYFCRFNSYTYFNDKMVFGLWGGNLISIIISTLIIMYLLFLYSKTKSNIEKTSLIFLMSGAISNILDRIFYLGVIDYIKLPLIPRFNLADICIVGGAIIYILISTKKSSEPR